MTWFEYLADVRVSFTQRVLLRGIFAYYDTSFVAKSFRFVVWENEEKEPLDEYNEQERDAWAAIGVTPELFEWLDADYDGGRCVYIVTPEIICEFHAARARQNEDKDAPCLPFK